METNHKYYFVEDLDPALEMADGQIIATMPQSAYALTRLGRPYSILEDYYDEKELRQKETEYFFEQLVWFRDFDDFLKKSILSCEDPGIGYAKICYNFLKYFVDSIVIQSYMIRLFIQKTACDEIVYVKRNESQSPGQGPYDYMFRPNGELFSRLIPLATAQNRSFKFSIHSFAGKGSAAKETGPVAPGDRPTRPFARNLAKDFRDFLKYAGIRGASVPRQSQNVRVLFVHHGSPHLDPMIRQFILGGAAVYCRTGNHIHRVDRLETNAFDLTERRDERLIFESGKAAESLPTAGRFVLDWIDRQCGFGVAALTLPFLKKFITDDLIAILEKASAYEVFYDKSNIDYVITHTSADFDSKGALISAKRKGIETVGIQHGSDVFWDVAWQVSDIDAFDWYLTTDGLSSEKFKRSLKETYVSACRLLTAPHFLKETARDAQRKSQAPKRDAPTVLYIPTKLLIHQRYFNCMTYPAVWYFEYQKKLIDFFAQKKDFNFIYKHSAGRVNRYAETSVLPYLREKKASHMTDNHRSVRESLMTVDAVILDRPTTALYEVATSGLPVLALYPDFIEGLIDRECAAVFGKSLQQFSSFEDAFNRIDQFLLDFRKNPGVYQPIIPLQDERPVEQLMSQKGRTSGVEVSA